MPVYNGERFLRQSIESILSQSFNNFEFLIINDGSIDSTANILANYIDSRIQVVTHPKNLGLITALNNGLSLAHGKYIARMDADDVSFPYRFEKQVEYLDEHPEIGVLGCGIQEIDEKNQIIDSHIFVKTHSLIYWSMYFYCPIAHPTVMMRHYLLDLVNGYSNDMVDAEDYGLWVELSKITKLANLDDILLQHRLHDLSMSQKYIEIQTAKSFVIMQNMITPILENPIPINLVKGFWFPQKLVNKEILGNASLIYKLTQKYLMKIIVSDKEKAFIVNDAFLRLINLVKKSKKSIYSLWPILLALRLSPSRSFTLIKSVTKHLLFDRVNIE